MRQRKVVYRNSHDADTTPPTEGDTVVVQDVLARGPDTRLREAGRSPPMATWQHQG
jgi:hypothetical protein